MDLADALSESGRRFTPDQVLLKGHELNHDQYGTRSSPHEARSQLGDVVLDMLCSGSFVREWESAMCLVEELRLSIHK